MISLLRVMHDGKSIGQLAIQPSGVIVFQYDRDWLVHGFDLAPGSVPFDQLANKSVRPGEFDGLPGAFYDSLPDGWGLLLMDRALKKHKGLDRTQITPLDRLAYMGHRCMGALEYEPELLPAQAGQLINVADIADQAEQILKGETSDVLEELRIYGGSPGGARPKITVAFSADMSSCQSGFRDIPDGYSHWMVKFRNDNRSGDSDPADIGRLEMAYSEMARTAGLVVPRTKLLEMTVRGKREAFFAAERFDREKNRKIHFLSLAGYAYANHHVPCMDYRDGVLPATRKLTRSDGEVERAFRLMLFNVLTHNKDDHTKNFAYLRDPSTGLWHLAPAFDLTFSVGMADNHTTSIGGAGNPTYEHLKNVAERHRIKDWSRVLDDVRSAVAEWPKFAEAYGLSKQRISEIHKTLKAIDKVCAPKWRPPS